MTPSKIIALLLLLLAGCESLAAPTITPTRSLSGPTIAPTDVVRPLLPTELPPGDSIDGLSNPTAAALPRDSSLPPLAIGTVRPGVAQSIQLTVADGVFLVGDLLSA